MKNEFFESHEKLGVNDFSTQAILNEIEQARRGSAWTTAALKRAHSRANDMLDMAEQHQSPLEVLVSIGEEEDGQKVYVEKGDQLHAMNPREGTVLLGEVQEFTMRTYDEKLGLYMAIACSDIGDETCWVPVARVGEQGFALRASGLADATDYEDVQGVWAGDSRYDQAVEVQRYREVAEGILFDTVNSASERMVEDIEDFVQSGPVDIEQLTTDMNMAMLEGAKRGQGLYVDLSGEVMYPGGQGDWQVEYVIDQEYTMIAVDLYESQTEDCGFGALAYMQTDVGKIVCADMRESNFLIGVGDFVDDDISDDTLDNE